MYRSPGHRQDKLHRPIAVEKEVTESCSKTLKRVTLELDGNDAAAIIYEDVDFDKVVPPVSPLDLLSRKTQLKQTCTRVIVFFRLNSSQKLSGRTAVFHQFRPDLQGN